MGIFLPLYPPGSNGSYQLTNLEHRLRDAHRLDTMSRRYDGGSGTQPICSARTCGIEERLLVDTRFGERTWGVGGDDKDFSFNLGVRVRIG